MNAWLRHHVHCFVRTVHRLLQAPLATVLNVLVLGTALSLPVAAYVVLTNVQAVLGTWSAEEQISVFLDPAADRSDAREVERRLRAFPGVRNVVLVPRESALARLQRSPELADVLAVLEHNPLPDGLIVTMASRDAAAADRVAAAARELPRVTHVQSDTLWARRLDAFLRLGRAAATVLGAVLGLALVAVTFNTIRLQILTQREEIEVARLVGATDSFVRRPFFYLGAVQGALGGLAALGIVAGAVRLLQADVAALATLYGSRFRLEGLGMADAGSVIAFSALLGWLGAYLSVSRHLR